MTKGYGLIALALIAAPAAARDIVVTPGMSAAAYEHLMAGRNAQAVELLGGEQSEPSRLINLGTAHARLGHKAEAAAAYRLALSSDDRYDVELFDGRTMDSKAAARAALVRLDDGGTLIAVR